MWVESVSGEPERNDLIEVALELLELVNALVAVTSASAEANHSAGWVALAIERSDDVSIAACGESERRDIGRWFATDVDSLGEDATRVARPPCAEALDESISHVYLLIM